MGAVMRPARRAALWLAFVLHETAYAMKCSLQSRDLNKPGWWTLYPLMKTLDAAPYQMGDKKAGYTYFFNVCDNTKRCLQGAMSACQVSNSGQEWDMGMEHWGHLAPMTFIDMKHANEESGKSYDT